MTGAELRARRKALGLSQGRLAKRLGVSPNTVARWERGELTIGRPEMVHMSLTQIEREVRTVTQTQRIKPMARLDLCCLDGSSSTNAPARPYLQIDTRDGSLAIAFAQEAHQSVPMNVWHGIVRRLHIPTNADGADLTQRINAGEIDALIARIVAGSSVEWDGSNHVGSRNADAEAALEDLQTWLDGQADESIGGLWDAADWLQLADISEFGLTAASTDAELATIAQGIESDAAGEDVVLYGTEAALQRMRDQLRDKALLAEDA